MTERRTGCDTGWVADEAAIEISAVADTTQGKLGDWPFDSFAASGTTQIRHDTARSLPGSRLSLRMDTGAGPGIGLVYWDQPGSVGTLTDHYGRVYFWPAQAFGTTNTFDHIVEIDDPVGNIAAYFGFNASNFQVFWDSTGTAKATGAVAASIGQWNRLEYHVTHSTTVGVMETRFFVGANWNGETPDETLRATGLNVLANGGQYYYGLFETNANWTVWLGDMVAGAQGWPGPTRPAAFRARRMPLGV